MTSEEIAETMSRLARDREQLKVEEDRLAEDPDQVGAQKRIAELKKAISKATRKLRDARNNSIGGREKRIQKGRESR